MAVRERWAMTVEAKALVLVTAVLLAFGLAVLYSASSIVALQRGDPSTAFLVRQIYAAVIGTVAFAVAAKIDAERWREWGWPLYGVTAVLMLVIVLPFVPAVIAPEVYGSRRFLLVPGIGGVQPAEFAKLTVIIWTAMMVMRKGEEMRHLIRGLSPFFVGVGFLAILAGVQPDVSMSLTYLLIMLVMLFASGARIGHFLFLGAVGLPLLVKWVLSHEYILRRLEAILHPGSGLDGAAGQLREALIAVGSGGLFGRGYGEGMQQAGWVPLGYNDFIGSVIGEEFGFAGMLFVVGAFALYGWLGYRIALQGRTRFQQSVAIGITFTMLLTAYIHMGVVTGLLPTTGLTLPFVSLGGSNLLLSLVMTGILVNIGSTRERVYSHSSGSALDDRVQVVQSV